MNRTIATLSLILFSLFLFSNVLCNSDVSMAPMEKKEQEALYLAIQGFVGKWWNGSDLYPDPCGWTPIQGVSCDLFSGLWYITVLTVGPVFDNSLACAGNDADFTPYLFELRHLRSLSFFSCFDSPVHHPITIPSRKWEKLAESLETLEFRSNRGLVRGIPPVIGRLTNLRSLVLVENSLAGELPEQLGDLVRLRRLALAGNRFSGRIPGSLGANLSELLILDLSGNSLTGPLPKSVGGLGSLLKLDLSNNRLQGNLPSEIGTLRSLTLLDLKNNSLSGGLPESLQGLSSIQDLLLSNNPMGGDLMGIGWENLRNLTTLGFSNMGLSGEIPESMARLRRLRFLALDGNRLRGGVPSKLAALPCLRALYLNGNNLTGRLGFSEEFYERMGRRFACWGNPSLCFDSGVVAAEHRPLGVEQCKSDEQGGSIFGPDSNNKVSGDDDTDHNSSPMASFGSSASLSTGHWWVIPLVVFLLVLMS